MDKRRAIIVGGLQAIGLRIARHLRASSEYEVLILDTAVTGKGSMAYYRIHPEWIESFSGIIEGVVSRFGNGEPIDLVVYALAETPHSRLHPLEMKCEDILTSTAYTLTAPLAILRAVLKAQKEPLSGFIVVPDIQNFSPWPQGELTAEGVSTAHNEVIRQAIRTGRVEKVLLGVIEDPYRGPFRFRGELRAVAERLLEVYGEMKPGHKVWYRRR